MRGEVAASDLAHRQEQVVDRRHDRRAQRSVLPASHRDGDHEHRAGHPQRDEHDVVLGGLLGSDIGVDLAVHRVARRSILIEQCLATQQKALLRGRIGHRPLERQRRGRPFTEPALLGDPHREDRVDEVRACHQVYRRVVAGDDLCLTRVVRGEERLVTAVEVSAKSGLVVEHAVLRFIDGVAAGKQGVHAWLEMSEHGHEARASDHQGRDDEQGDRHEPSRQSLGQAAIRGQLRSDLHRQSLFPSALPEPRSRLSLTNPGHLMRAPVTGGLPIVSPGRRNRPKDHGTSAPAAPGTGRWTPPHARSPGRPAG